MKRKSESNLGTTNVICYCIHVHSNYSEMSE